jgi:hypothetical protein
LGEQKAKHLPLSAWCELEAMLEMIVEKEWLRNMSKMFFENQFDPFSINFMKRGMHVITSHTNFKCA